MNSPNVLRALAASPACVCALALCARGQGQQASPRPKTEEEVVRVSTSLVQVDAVVSDEAGRAVTDLRPEEFRLFEDGRPRAIKEFSFVETAGAADDPRDAKPRAGANEPPAPRMPLAQGRARRTVALLVDDVGLSFETTAYVRKALSKFVDEQMQPGDLFALIRTSGGAGSLPQFTSDRRQLRAAVERLRWYPVGRGGVAAVETMYPEEIDENGLILRGRRSSAKLDASGFEYFGGTLGALGYVVRGLGRFPGRKSVVLISDNLPVTNREALGGGALKALKGITDEANRTSVVIYSMDPRGFSKFGLTALFADDRKLGPYVHALIYVAARDLKFEEAAGGWRTASFDLIAVAYDDAGQTDWRRLVAGGSLRLGTDLRPGAYLLQIVVRDLLAEEPRRIATSWIDFEIVD